MKIAVIMSTYNGEKYLIEQVDSVLMQRNVDVELYIRDDGSIDNTISILQSYNNPNIHIYTGDNIGYAKSFLKMLSLVDGYKYYAFCDQDDYWEPNKLITGIREIESKVMNNEKPVIYYSNLKITDENLNLLRFSKWHERKETLESFIIRYSIAGCSMIFNQSMWRIAFRNGYIDEFANLSHDMSLIYLCLSVKGKLICDQNSYILYRQHKTNTSMATDSILKRIKKEFKDAYKFKKKESELVKVIMDNWSDMIRKEQKSVLLTIVRSRDNYLYRLKIFFSIKYTSGNILLNVCGKLKALFGFI